MSAAGRLPSGSCCRSGAPLQPLRPHWLVSALLSPGLQSQPLACIDIENDIHEHVHRYVHCQQQLDISVRTFLFLNCFTARAWLDRSALRAKLLHSLPELGEGGQVFHATTWLADNAWEYFAASAEPEPEPEGDMLADLFHTVIAIDHMKYALLRLGACSRTVSGIRITRCALQ